jgi:hypothetical protein
MSKVPFDEYTVREIPKEAVHWRNSFDSRYLRHFWLNGKPRVVTIAKVQELQSKNSRTGETKTQILVTLAEAEKPWAINVTNCDIIEMLTSKANPREWVGTRIELYPTKTRGPTGAMVDCIRVRDRLPEATRKAEKPKHRQEVSQLLREMKDAKDLGELVAVGGKVSSDPELSDDERLFLRNALARRSEQLSAPGEGQL